MNDFMSIGMHRIWKEAMIDWLAPRPNQKLLDVAGGTGDIAFRFLDRTNGEGDVTILDMTENMLSEGKKRYNSNKLDKEIKWVCGDAMMLPFPSNSFDSYTISFGIRNVTRIQDALNEAFRVLRSGGRLMILEFSTIPNESLQKIYDKYSFDIIPLMGRLIAKDMDSYKYLVESIRQFPKQEDFSSMIRTSGFSRVKHRNLSLGIVSLHSGWKI
jgi:demethylmenaquinone methyltransferase/2-methoxy-6-polyprenyl-1,4-benzoquinol methylase